jgi:type IV secretory pathway TrbL component
MNADVLDLMAAIFDTALRNGFATLMAYAIPLLGALAVIRFYATMAPVVASGAGLGDALGTCLWTLLIIGIYYYLLVNLEPLIDAGLNTFVTWGLAPGHGAFSLGDFLLPSRLIRAGWIASTPIRELIQGMGWGKAAPWNWPTLVIYVFCFLGIAVAFAVLTVETLIALFEFRFAAMVSAVLVPWGVLTQTAFFAELSIAWVVGGLIRMLITAALVGITITLFDIAVLVPGEDPGISEAFLMAVVAGFFAAVSVVIPKRAAAIGGRGMAMALGTGDVFGPFWRTAGPVVAGVIRGQPPTGNGRGAGGGVGTNGARRAAPAMAGAGRGP